MATPLVFAKLSTSIPLYHTHRVSDLLGRRGETLGSGGVSEDVERASRVRCGSASSAVGNVWENNCSTAAQTMYSKPRTGSHTRIRLNSAAQPASPIIGILPLPSISPSTSRSDLASQISRILSSPASRRRSINRLLCVTGIHRVSRHSDSQSFWLILYFALNLLLTLYNKLILVTFPFPYTLTALHALCGSLGGQILLRHDVYQPKNLRVADYLVLAAFSILYSVNIAISNVSLDLVTIPFHQVVRAATPIFTTFLSWYFFNTHFSQHKIVSLVPVIAGVGLATYGDYSCTTWGFCLTLLGTFLAASKTIATHLLQSASMRAPPVPHARPRIIRLPSPFLHVSISVPRFPTFCPSRLHLHPLDLLTRMSPLAFVQCTFYAHMAGELDALRFGHTNADISLYSRHPATYVVLLAINGMIAFALNVVSFEANRRAGALSMGVAANVKQVLTIVCAVSIFHLTLTFANALGVALTLLGGAWYAIVEYSEKGRRSNHTRS